VGGARELVAPKRREEAAAIPDAKLLEWLAADGKRVRRPIIEAGPKVTLGFSSDVQDRWS
jgi:arsenate reductase-like glutaredoxin family protein